MNRITVYADFDFLASAQEIGTLGYEHVRGKDHFVFEYSRQWLKQHDGRLREVKRYGSDGMEERFAGKKRVTFSVLPIRKTPCACTQNTLWLYAK